MIWSSSKTYHCPTNMPTFVELPEVGEAIAVLPGIEILDSDKGMFDWGSIQPIGNEEVILLTSEPGFVGKRRFNGHSYGPNEAFTEELGQGRMSDDLNSLNHATATIYNGHDGYLIWGSKNKTAEDIAALGPVGDPFERCTDCELYL